MRYKMFKMFVKALNKVEKKVFKEKKIDKL